MMWRNLKIIKQNERSQSRKATCYVIPLIRNTQNRKCTETGSGVRLLGPRISQVAQG